MVWLDAITDKLPGPLRLRVRGRSMLPTLRPGDEVVVQPVTAEALIPGDWVVVHGAQDAFLHRYLGRRHGRILTKGDGHMGFDPVWPPEAVLGRVVEAQRDGRCFYRRAAGQLRRERLFTAGHQILGDVWGVLRRVKALWLALVAIAFAVTLVWAAVTLTSFTAEASTECEDDAEVCVILEWETASETDNLGFRLWRSLTENNDDDYEDISGFIGSLGGIVGASYVFTDTTVIPGTTYYYKLQDLPVDGNLNSYTDSISAAIPTTLTLTPTLTATPTHTPTPTPTSTSSPTSTPNPNVRFWADKTDLAAGECTTLHWETSNITTLLFDGMGVKGNDYREFCPCATESHVLHVKYRGGATEDFTITLNVTGQCGAAAASTIPAISPLATPVAGATATPRPTSTSRPNSLPADVTATASAEAFMATATASTEAFMATTTASAAMQAATQTAMYDAVQTAGPTLSPVATLTASSEIRVEAAAATSRLSPTRGPVAGESSGVPVEDMLSAWLLIVGGIIGAGFVGAGVLMWKRQQ